MFYFYISIKVMLSLRHFDTYLEAFHESKGSFHNYILYSSNIINERRTNSSIVYSHLGQYQMSKRITILCVSINQPIKRAAKGGISFLFSKFLTFCLAFMFCLALYS